MKLEWGTVDEGRPPCPNLPLSRWAIPRAVVLSAFGIGLFYVFCSYAWVIGTGFGDFTKVTTASANPSSADSAA